jgi:hypothetical protein
VLAATASLIRSDVDLTRAQYESPAAVTTDMRKARDLARLVPGTEGLLLEGLDASAAPKWTVPGTYYFASLGRTGPRISIVPSGDAGIYLRTGIDPGERYYSSDYAYVMTPFGGIASARTPIRRAGNLTLFRRAEIDVALVGTGWAIDPAEDAHAIPWVQEPFEVWLSTGDRREPIALEVGLERPLGVASSLDFSVARRHIGALSSLDGSQLCVQLERGRDPLVVDVEPRFDRPPRPAVRATERDPLPPPPKVVGISSLSAKPGSCADRLPEAVPVLSYSDGWYPTEYGSDGTSWRWMRTEGVLVVGAEGAPRPGARLRATLGSLAHPRQVSVRLDGRRIAQLEVPGGWATLPFDLRIPPGQGQAVVELEATPGAQSAEAVTPADPRMLAILMIDPVLSRLGEAP